MVTGLQPAWAAHAFRLDPARLPQQVGLASLETDGETEITVTHRGASVKRRLERSGLPLSIALPARAFKGIAVRAVDLDPEQAFVTIEMLHEDPALCVPLCLGHDLPAIASDWKIWAELMDLPMLLVTGEGQVESLEESMDAVDMRTPFARRPHALFAERRPRFLARRRLGHLGVRLMVAGQEIIARDPSI